ncbi:MAG: hypothetical protein HUK02_02265 [Bacteroidaceae bacterium]|nr:hypothetical protein [Bacteroidaceae bacterium]
MANKRQLKKAINQMCGDMFVESVVISHNHNNASQEDIDNIMKAILLLQNNMIRRVSHIEPGMKPKVYFRKLREDIIKETNEILDQLYNLA